MGQDGIPPTVLKMLALSSQDLSPLVFKSWESGEVPADWKLAKVPVFKKGRKEDPGNYSPVSLTLVPGKRELFFWALLKNT